LLEGLRRARGDLRASAEEEAAARVEATRAHPLWVNLEELGRYVLLEPAPESGR
jgi:hypothetical protein